MTRKDSEKETDRPHYYSQFWLDVAAGRKIIGSGRAGEEEGAEPEPQETTPRKSTRSSSATITREEQAYREVTPPVEEEAYEEEAYEEPEAEEDFLGAEEEFDTEQELPNILVEEAEVPDMELLDEDEEEDFYDEEEEEEEDIEWGRGRKKPKPGRQAKQPPKRSKRDRRY